MKTAVATHGTVTTNGRPLIIEGVAIPVEFNELPVGKVILDPDNPRIQHAVKQKFKSAQVKQADLLTLVYEQPGVPELYATIRDNGGLMEPNICSA